MKTGFHSNNHNLEHMEQEFLSIVFGISNFMFLFKSTKNTIQK